MILFGRFSPALSQHSVQYAEPGTGWSTGVRSRIAPAFRDNVMTGAAATQTAHTEPPKQKGAF